MKKITGVVFAVFMMFLVVGCTTAATTDIRVSLDSRFNNSTLGNFNDRMKDLADQLDRNAAAITPTGTYIVTSFTHLDKLDDTTPLGRLISENLMHGLQVNKWQIVEVRLTKGIDVNAAGEFSLSRDVEKIKDEYKISGVVTGTYSVAEGNVTVNARIVDVNTGIVISSGQTYIPVTWLPDGAFPHDGGNKSMKIVSDGIK